MILRRIAPLLLFVALVTVSPYAQAQRPAPLPAPADVAAAPTDAVVTASGLASRVLVKGTGTEHPIAASTVKVHYSGWTTDGEMFDSSVTRGEQISFGLTRVIKGWTEGVQLMVKGEKRRFWIPAALAYGENPRAGAPKGTLVFDVELFEFTTPADATMRLAAYRTHRTMTTTSPYALIPWRSIGPNNHSGRMTSIAVAGSGPTRTIYVGSATGGVWKSVNNGNTWRPIFERQATASIGDVAVAPSNPAVVYVGTGESNIFRASVSGTGMYKSINGGLTWTQIGLTDSGTIGRVLVHPTNSNIVYVAASGHEWTTNEMRGVFKTIDGGRTWTKSFYRSPSTGAVDLVMDPKDPNTLYAAMWQRTRRKWSDPRVEPNYTEGGIWKTTDAGATWTPINEGLPEPKFRGRIGLDVARSNANVVYAVIDSYDTGRPARAGENDAYGRPLPENSNIIRGMEIYRSDDKGATWKKTSGLTPETAQRMMSLGNTYNWVFTQIRVDTKNENRVYVLALDVSVSDDAGATFKSFGGGGDNHRLWIDPNVPTTIYTASDQGFTMRENGKLRNADGIHATQFYNVELDMAKPFHVYGSVQDAGSFRATVDIKGGRGLLKPLPWERNAPGGEGSVHSIPASDPSTVYSHGFYGGFTRAVSAPAPAPTPAAAAATTGRGARAGGAPATAWQHTPIRPKPEAGELPQRAQWMAPILVSPHDANVLYAGYQYVYRSTNKGDTWEKISSDLTDNNPRQM
ncbi:MAG: FKBP-type peptidyl-prolyl cis-trans isomerase, partial [Acidobacteria bacterium]|nr:FKBP-type peptidyl-prolyl cis-trans isomerase [Acidobacteriota bacterium]